MRHCDLVLLSVFMVEICLRLFGFGRHYLRDCINVVDAVVRHTQASNHPGRADPTQASNHPGLADPRQLHRPRTPD